MARAYLDPGDADTRAADGPSPLQALGILLGAVLAVVAASSTVSLIALWMSSTEGFFDPADSPFTKDARWIALLITSNALAGLAALALGMRAFGVSSRRVFPRPSCRGRSYAGALLLVVGSAPLANSVAEWAARLSGKDAASAQLAIAAALDGTNVEFAAILIAFAVAPAIVEETLFRGVATAALCRYGKWVALVLPSLAFGLYHLELSQGAGTFILGLAFGWARLQTGSIVPSILAHGTYNGLVLVALRVSGSPPQDPSIQAERAIMIASGALTVVVALMLLRRKPTPATA